MAGSKNKKFLFLCLLIPAIAGATTFSTTTLDVSPKGTTAYLVGLAATSPSSGTMVVTSALASTSTASSAAVTSMTQAELASSPSYDASVGIGVGSDGFAMLPVRWGASRYFVNSATGSDNNSCDDARDPTTPKATITAGVGCLALTGSNFRGPGDQLLIAEGTRYADGPGIGLTRRAGFSAAYPTVIQSYDPADPLNDARYGKAGTAGHQKRPVLNTGGTLVNLGGVNAEAVNFAYLAIRGLDWNPGNVARSTWNFNGGMDYLLLENNVIRYTQVNLNGIKPTVHHILRKNTLYGAWSDTGHSQCLYEDTTTGVTVEDNILWHCGWKVGASRDAAPAAGGATMYNHALYLQAKTYDVNLRRNVIIDPSSHGAQARGGASVWRNVYIDNPVAQLLGGGSNYDQINPNGVPANMARNLILGDADITSSLPRGIAIWATNTNAATLISNNLILRSRNGKDSPFVTTADYAKPTYAKFASNLVYNYGANALAPGGQFANLVSASFSGNIWDALASPGNYSSAAQTFPNPVTAQDMYTYLGCGSKQACINQMIETPDQNWADRIRLYAFQAYGQ